MLWSFHPPTDAMQIAHIGRHFGRNLMWVTVHSYGPGKDCDHNDPRRNFRRQSGDYSNIRERSHADGICECRRDAADYRASKFLRCNCELLYGRAFAWDRAVDKLRNRNAEVPAWDWQP